MVNFIRCESPYVCILFRMKLKAVSGRKIKCLLKINFSFTARKIHFAKTAVYRGCCTKVEIVCNNFLGEQPVLPKKELAPK